MAAAKLEVLISQLLDKIATPFQRLTPIIGVQQLNGAIANTVDVSGSRFLKMAAAKPEVHISQLLDQIATPFQRLTPIFGVHEFNRTIMNA